MTISTTIRLPDASHSATTIIVLLFQLINISFCIATFQYTIFRSNLHATYFCANGIHASHGTYSRVWGEDNFPLRKGLPIYDNIILTLNGQIFPLCP